MYFHSCHSLYSLNIYIPFLCHNKQFTYMHIHIYRYIKIHACLTIGTYIHTHLPTYTFIYRHTTYMHACTHAYIQTHSCLSTYTHTNTHAYSHICMALNIHTYTSANIHIYLHQVVYRF